MGRFTAGQFARINKAALANAPVVFKSFNKRSLKRLEINRYNFRFHDKTNGKRGDNAISLTAYVLDLPKNEAARVVAQTLEAASKPGV